ncbi:MAG: MBL fold metallo-hydrolase [Neomegalonema sp.]|nr:MBL fold metallo-hydrolase [Neomegalonema sp.]
MTNRRDFLAVSAGLVLTPFLPGAAFAAGGATQVVGVYRRSVGDITVTALLDGFLKIDPKVLTGYDAATADKLLREAFLAAGPIDTSVNAYVVQTGGKTVLVDGGAATAFGPTLGKLGAALGAAGVKPEEVDEIFCTHLHPDHIGAFTTAEGAAAFPKAQLHVHEADAAFWGNDANFAKAGEMAQNFAKAAQRALAAYKDRTILVKDGATVAPGATVAHLPGHTPGHSGLMVASGDASMLLWADIVHVGPVQFQNPSWTIPFDVDQPLAAKTRAKTLDMAASDRLEVAGAHIDFPSFGYVAKAGAGYRFTPSRWDHQL